MGVYTKMMSGGGKAAPWDSGLTSTKLEALEQGSMLSMRAFTKQLLAGTSKRAASRYLVKGCLAPARVWDKRAPDLIGPGGEQVWGTKDEERSPPPPSLCDAKSIPKGGSEGAFIPTISKGINPLHPFPNAKDARGFNNPPFASLAVHRPCITKMHKVAFNPQDNEAASSQASSLGAQSDTGHPDLRSVTARGGFYQSTSQLESGGSKRHEKRLSQVSLQLWERRKLRIMYGGLSNREIDNSIRKGFIGRGRFGDNLFKLLESRLDVVLWRIGFFPTIPTARNWVACGRVLVNSRAVTVANYWLQPGDIVSISPQFIGSLRKFIAERRDTSLTPSCIASDAQALQRKRHTGGQPTPTSSPTTKLSWRDGSRRGLREPTLLSGGDVWRESSSLPLFGGLIGAPSPGASNQEQAGWSKGVGWFCVKSSHVEVSYPCLIAIYLYPPQKIFLPAPVDLETIRRW
jgi:small subunit ribosomal protein S4